VKQTPGKNREKAVLISIGIEKTDILEKDLQKYTTFYINSNHRIRFSGLSIVIINQPFIIYFEGGGRW